MMRSLSSTLPVSWESLVLLTKKCKVVEINE